MKKDPNRIRPYGDHWDDGKIQVSFTLPTPVGEKAREAARLYLERLGLERVEVCTMEAIGDEFSFFVAFGHARHHVSLDSISVAQPEISVLPTDQLVKMANERLRRRIVVIGAATGSDAHTVGIDAILSMKGVAGERGLEYYPIFKVVNLRAQVDNRHLVEKAAELKADAILVSKMVTQQDQHLKDLKDLTRLIRDEKRLPSHLVKIAGGPRLDHRTARSVGFDAGFGPGTKPSEVANFIMNEMIRRTGLEITPKDKGRMVGESSPPAEKKGWSLFGWLGGGS